jgi:hypothetical protein
MKKVLKTVRSKGAKKRAPRNTREKTVKSSVPNIFDGMSGGLPELGGFAFNQKGGDFEVEWQHRGKEKQVALFSELCRLDAKQMDRRDAGLLIAEILAHEAQRIMDSIGGPTESWNYSEPIRKMADGWRGWAMAPAGPMPFDNPAKKTGKRKR